MRPKEPKRPKIIKNNKIHKTSVKKIKNEKKFGSHYFLERDPKWHFETQKSKTFKTICCLMHFIKKNNNINKIINKF